MKTFRVKGIGDFGRDLLTGVIIALLSVPLAMGYAMVAGMPPVYGLYGTLLSMLVFGLVTTSPRFVFGVDAAPSAMAGALLVELGIAAGSAEAVAVMPIITLTTALWLLLFWVLGGGRLGKFISEPVLGGCITGIACTVILKQFPVLFGGVRGVGHAPELIVHILEELAHFHPLSFLLGAVTVAVILWGRKKTKLSVSVIMMLLGIALGAFCHLDRYGVALLGEVPAGLPRLARFDLGVLVQYWEEILGETLAMALVIFAETYVSTRELGHKFEDELDPQRELLAYGLGNLVAGIFGSSPAVGSASRTNRANVRGVSSQWMSISTPLVLGLVLLFGTPYLAYLPIPMLMGILIASLVTITEFPMAAELWKVDRWEFAVFFATLAAELLGFSEGVVVGVVLTFASFTIKATNYPSYFLGVLQGRQGFYDLKKNPRAQPVLGAVMYQFNGSLFYANVEDFVKDIRGALKENTHMVVVTGVYSVDALAAERLLHFYHKLKERGISFFMAGHAGSVNEQLIDFGAEELIRNGVVRQRLTQAMEAGGLHHPYPTERRGEEELVNSEALESFTWAYGKYATPRLEDLAGRLADDMMQNGSLDFEKLSIAERELAGEYWSEADEEEFLDLLEMSLAASAEGDRDLTRFRSLARSLLERRVRLERQLIRRGDLSVAKEFISMRLKREAEFYRSHPEAGALLGEERSAYMEMVEKEDPEAAEIIHELTKDLHPAGGSGKGSAAAQAQETVSQER